MQIALRFNSPPQQDKVQVTFGEQNDDDAARQFRVGVIKAGQPGAVHWSLLGWVGGSESTRLNQLDLEVDRGDTVRVERKDSLDIVTYFEVETEGNWPAAATGNTEILSTWGFED